MIDPDLQKLLLAPQARYGAPPMSRTNQAIDTAARQLQGFLEVILGLVDVDVRFGSTREGNRYASVTVKTDNPLDLMERIASEILRICGLYGVSVTVNQGETRQDLEFVFSVGNLPQD
jgi:hypothetical protein